MPRETFQQELDDLMGEVLKLGGEVEGSLETMVEILREHVSSVRAHQRPSTPTVGFPRYMAVESEARH